ncbi:beta-L-arabinofuranosidase domain-containing protein [Deminuibacter soli]|nr:beta-L-arabinofuranosidase domain-containing protein [Deminuibacter soli]
MQRALLLFTCLLSGLYAAHAQVASHLPFKADSRQPYAANPATHLQFDGYLGEKLQFVTQHSINAQDVASLVAPFKERNESSLWQTEFWGKWMLSAVKAYAYDTTNTALLHTMQQAVTGILATQTADGYIGNYAPGKHLQGWDVWGRKYTLLGLVYYYDLTGDKKALAGAERLLDYTLTEIGPGKANIVLTGNFRGMPSSSILEPVMLLYERTGNKNYLAFAQYIVTQWETPEGPQLISKALQNVPVAQRFTTATPEEWWTWKNGAKAYEMMSCYDGLLKLYRFTGNKDYLNAVVQTVANIRQTEINIVGSGAAMECWYGGQSQQYFPSMHTMETCVTITWMKLCYELYRITGNPQLLDDIETTAYNNLPGSLSPSGRFSKYSSLQGFRDLDEFQCNMHINCCMANGPRGYTLLPDVAVMQQQQNIYLNLYNAAHAQLQLPGNHQLQLQLTTGYPADGDVAITLQPDAPVNAAINLRIPAWSAHTQVAVNGKPVTDSITPGRYFTLQQTWKKGDVITLHVDMRIKTQVHHTPQGDFAAFTRGPVVLARDSRFSSYPIDAAITSTGSNNDTAEQAPAARPGAWLYFTRYNKTGSGENPVNIDIPLVDFSSAGNNWDVKSRYRVWIPVEYNVSGIPAEH